MEWDTAFIKLTFLILLQQVIAVFKQNITRWIIKTFFTAGEMPIGRWYTWEFISAMNMSRVFGLVAIASFTLITFPLGIWIASFKLNRSFPVIRIVTASVLMVSFPVNLYIMSQKINEMPINQTTLLGAGIIELSYLILAIGSWYMYQGANQT